MKFQSNGFPKDALHVDRLSYLPGLAVSLTMDGMRTCNVLLSPKQAGVLLDVLEGYCLYDAGMPDGKTTIDSAGRKKVEAPERKPLETWTGPDGRRMIRFLSTCRQGDVDIPVAAILGFWRDLPGHSERTRVAVRDTGMGPIVVHHGFQEVLRALAGTPAAAN